MTTTTQERRTGRMGVGEKRERTKECGLTLYAPLIFFFFSHFFASLSVDMDADHIVTKMFQKKKKKNRITKESCTLYVNLYSPKPSRFCVCVCMYFYILAVAFFIFFFFFIRVVGLFFIQYVELILGNCRMSLPDTQALLEELARPLERPISTTCDSLLMLETGARVGVCTAYCLFLFSVTNGDGGRESSRWKRAQPKM